MVNGKRTANSKTNPKKEGKGQGDWVTGDSVGNVKT